MELFYVRIDEGISVREGGGEVCPETTAGLYLHENSTGTGEGTCIHCFIYKNYKGAWTIIVGNRCPVVGHTLCVC